MWLDVLELLRSRTLDSQIHVCIYCTHADCWHVNYLEHCVLVSAPTGTGKVLNPSICTDIQYCHRVSLHPQKKTPNSTTLRWGLFYRTLIHFTVNCLEKLEAVMPSIVWREGQASSGRDPVDKPECGAAPPCQCKKLKSDMVVHPSHPLGSRSGSIPTVPPTDRRITSGVPLK